MPEQLWMVVWVQINQLNRIIMKAKKMLSELLNVGSVWCNESFLIPFETILDELCIDTDIEKMTIVNNNYYKISIR